MPGVNQRLRDWQITTNLRKLQHLQYIIISISSCYRQEVTNFQRLSFWTRVDDVFLASGSFQSIRISFVVFNNWDKNVDTSSSVVVCCQNIGNRSVKSLHLLLFETCHYPFCYLPDIFFGCESYHDAYYQYLLVSGVRFPFHLSAVRMNSTDKVSSFRLGAGRGAALEKVASGLFLQAYRLQSVQHQLGLE
jgi:hypothetical protein